MGGLFGGGKTTSTKENKIGSLRIQSSSQGLPIPLVFGKTRISPNLLWYGDFKAIAKTKKKKAGKGGGGQTVKNTTYTYTCAVIFGLLEGPSVGSPMLGTIWSDKDITDATKLGLTEFSGSYSQTAWTYTATNHANQALAYRGVGYAASATLDLGNAGAMPNFSFEVTGFIDDADVNLADVLEQILTADKFGAGWPSAQLASLVDFESYCAAAGFLASPAYVAQVPCAEMVTELCVMGNSAPVWSDGTLKIKPYADEVVGAYTPDLTVQYNLGYSDFLASPGTPPVKLTRKRQADAFNQIQVECLDRSNGYNTYIAEAKDQWNIDVYGLRPKEPIKAHAICDPAVAQRVAQTILQRELYIRNEYEFTVGWRYARLEPMDIVSLTDPLLGFDLKPVRIKSIQENDNGELTITAEDLNIGVSTPGTYATQTVVAAEPAVGVDPGDAYTPVIFQPPLALTQTPQVWIGAQGGLDWGGAEVYVSTDGGTSYAQVGTISNPARYGVLTANLPVGVDPDTVNTLAVDLTVSRGELVDSPQSSADELDTLCYVGGELISHSNATLTAPYEYDLDTYLRRGQAGSSIAAHVIGDTFMRLDDAVEAFDIATSLYGTTIHVKLLSFNKQGGGLQSLADVSATTFNIVAQAQTGAGYSFIIDRSTTTVGDPGSGLLRLNAAAQANATVAVFDLLTQDGANMTTAFSSFGNTGVLELRDALDSAKWATFTVSAGVAQSGYQTFNVTHTASGAEFANGRTLLATLTKVGVTGVGLSMPATIFTVANSPVTTTGNLTVSLVSQNAALFLAGPLTGNAAAPAFRAIAATDFNGGANASANTVLHGDLVWRSANASAGGIGSVALTVPSFLSVANSPLTSNGTLAVSLANQPASTFLAGPASGANAAPTFRAIDGGDMPPLTINTQTANYTLALSDGNGRWVEVNSSSNLVVTVPSQANVAWTGNVIIPIERLGTGTVTIAAEANVTVRNSSSATVRAQYSVVGLKRRAADDWTLFGDVT